MPRRVSVVLVLAAMILSSCAPKPPPLTGPAAFVTSDFTIAPNSVRQGEDTTVTVLVTNTGGQTGTYNLELKVDGKIEKTENVTLAGGKSQRVSLNVVVPVMGIYVISVDNYTGTLMVGIQEN